MDRLAAADYHDIAKPVSPRLSPDGETVAFVRKIPDDEDSYAATVHLVSADGSEPPRQFTVAEGVDSQPRWSPSGDRIAFVSTRGADADRPQLWVVPVAGGEARRVTAVPGGVSDIAWSPDGTRIAFVQSTTADEREDGLDASIADEEEYERETPDPRVVDRTVYRTAETYFDGTRSHVYLAHLGDGIADYEAVAVERLTDGDIDHQSPTWSDDATLYYAADDVGPDPDDSVRYSIHAHDTDADEAEQVHETSGWGAGLAATGDDRVAFLYSEAEQSSIQPTELKVLDVAADAVHHVTADLDRSLGYEAAPQWTPDEERVVFSTPDAGKTSLWSAPGDAGEAPRRLVRPGHVSAGHVRDDRIVLAVSEWDHPGDVFVGSREPAADPGLDGDGVARESLTRLTELNADWLDDVAVQQPESLTVESEQGEVQGWVLTPPEFDPEESHPMVVEVHGGPHAMWSTAGTMWHEFQTLAARGYVVFWSNPRGSTGYGEAYMQAIERDWGEVTLTDVMAGVREVAARDGVDEDQVFLTGGSFGGFMTAWAVGQTDYFAGAVAQRGVYDLTGFYGSTDWAYKLVEGDFDTTPWAEPEFLWERSPTGHAHEVDTPTLLIHSDDDYRTPDCTAELYHRLLRKHGVETRLVRYPREGHELSRSGEPTHVVDRIERIARWFDGYSEFHDAPKAIERDRGDGLSAGEDEGESEDESEPEDGDSAD
ncbi:MAG: prolyl oligopeptidase family serine peptidase [Halolamina sp.]